MIAGTGSGTPTGGAGTPADAKAPAIVISGAIGARKRFSVTLRVEAIDRSGNSSVATRTAKVK